ncbi:MAG: hypothetical protein WC408_03225, partial [Candidatus Micrarchaeia archaeon]
MAKEKNSRILDKDFEAGITDKADEIQAELRSDIRKAQKIVQEDINKAQKYVYEKNDEVEAMIREHPKSFVLGSFL